MNVEQVIEIAAESDLGVAARILDLFTAQVRIPAAFSFVNGAGGLSIRLSTGSMPDHRRSALLARFATLPGVRSVAFSADMSRGTSGT